MHRSTLGRAYTELINSFSEAAQDHSNFADGLDAQVVNALKLVEKGHDETKKKVYALSINVILGPNSGFLSQQVKAFQKLVADRDRAYGDRAKVRGSAPLFALSVHQTPHFIRANKWYILDLLGTEASC